MMLVGYAIPALSLALVAAAAVGRRMSDGLRRATIAGAILIACGAFTLLRTGGVAGSGASELHWRWTPTPEERLLSQAKDEQLPPPPAPVAAEPPAVAQTASCGNASGPGGRPRADAPAPPIAAEWPGFRGADRDGVVRGVRIETDWARAPAQESLAPADRPRLVVVRGPRGPSLHAGAARGRGDRRLLQRDNGRAGVAPPRRHPVLGIERRRRPARDADARRRPRLRDGGDRTPERARCRHGRRRVVAQRRVRHRHEGPDVGLRRLSARDRRRGRRGRVGQAGRLRRRRPGTPRWLGPATAGATARRIA